MAVHIKFEFFGEEQVDRTLVGWSKAADDMTPAWEQIERRFTDWEEKWFQSEGNGTWPSLSPSYARWKEKHFPGEPILRREGTLKDSVTEPSISIMEPSYAIFGTDDPVAVYHQKGGGRLPRRRVINLSDSERAEWIKIVQRHLLASDRAAMGTL